MRLSSSTAPLRFVACALVLVAMARCGSSKNDAPSPTSAVIGTAGGSLTSSDGVLQVVVPPGAVSSSVTLTVTPTTSPPAGSLGAAYDVGPSATVLQAPVTVVFHYASVALGGSDPAKLFVATHPSTAATWTDLPDPLAHPDSKTVSGTALQFALFGLVEATTAPIGDGGAIGDSGPPVDAGTVCSGTLTPSSGGSPCVVTEGCNTGHEYTISCSPTSNACDCTTDGTKTTTASIACSALGAISLEACGYPIGTIVGGSTSGADAAAPGCVYTVYPVTTGADGGTSCAVAENCGAAGHYEMLCDGTTKSCSCNDNGQTVGVVMQDCATISQTSIAKCLF